MGQLNFIRNIPNSITALNLVSGIIAIIFALYGFLTYAGYFILLAAVFDFFDGLAARALKVHSEIGKELDSLADVVSFGVAPTIIMFQLMAIALGGQDAFVGMFEYMSSAKIPPVVKVFMMNNLYGNDGVGFWTYFFLGVPFLIAIFSAFRLAKFNLDTRQTSSFIGLPVPANAIFMLSLGIIVENSATPSSLLDVILHPMTLLSVCVFFSYLLVSELPMFALKFKNLSLKDNALRYGFIAFAVAVIAIFKLYGLPIIILAYILTSFVVWIADTMKSNKMLY